MYSFVQKRWNSQQGNGSKIQEILNKIKEGAVKGGIVSGTPGNPLSPRKNFMEGAQNANLLSEKSSTKLNSILKGFNVPMAAKSVAVDSAIKKEPFKTTLKIIQKTSAATLNSAEKMNLTQFSQQDSRPTISRLLKKPGQGQKRSQSRRDNWTFEKKREDKAAVLYNDNLILEELFMPPIFDSAKYASLPTDLKNKLQEFVPPVQPEQIEESLTAEFDQPIMATNFKDFVSTSASHSTANRMIREVVLHESLVSKYKKEPISFGSVKSFVKKECDVMLNEINTGDYSRHENFNLPSSYKKEHSKEAMDTAAHALRMNPHLHPIIKNTILQTIAKHVDI